MLLRKSEPGGHVVLALLKNAWVPVALVVVWLLGKWVENPERFDPYYARVIMLVGINITLAVSLQLINGISGQFSLGHAGFMAVGAYVAGYASNTYGTLTGSDGGTLYLSNPAGIVLYFVCLGAAVSVAMVISYGVAALLQRSGTIHPSLPGILMLAALAWLVWDVYAASKLVETPAYLIWSKMFSLIPRLFETMMTHGLSMALRVTSWLPASLLKPACFLVALIGGGLFAAIAGLLVGLPTLRLRGDYLAIATLGAAEIIRVLITNSAPLGRATGLSLAPYANPAEDGAAAHYIFPWIYGAALLTTLFIWRLQHSPKGRSIAAVREDEIAAAATGVNVVHHKVIAFVIGAFFAGVAGALYAHFDGYLNPNEFNLMRSIELVVMVTLGGLGNIWGAIIAAVVLTILPELLRNQPAIIKESRMVIYSLLLVILMICRATRPWRYLLPARRPA